MKTIIAATDFSPAANNAVNYAANMAIAINAKLLLFYSFEVPIAYGEIPVVGNAKEIQGIAEKDMKELIDKITERTGNKVEISSIIMIGSFFPLLKTACENIRPYAVVMGSQGTSGTERFFFGSNTIFAMKHLDWPLITVPPDRLFSSIKRIAIACDFDNVVTTTPIEEIKTLVNDFNAKLYVINSGKKDAFNAEEVFATKMLEELLAPIKPEFHFIAEGNTDETIIHFAESNNIDLLMILPKRHGIIQKMTHKSHTRQIVLHSHVPVIALKEIKLRL